MDLKLKGWYLLGEGERDLIGEDDLTGDLFLIGIDGGGTYFKLDKDDLLPGTLPPGISKDEDELFPWLYNEPLLFGCIGYDWF